jgi:hypothetical protein
LNLFVRTDSPTFRYAASPNSRFTAAMMTYKIAGT